MIVRRSSQHAPAPRRCAAPRSGARCRTTAATSARSVIVPTSLLTAITLTTRDRLVEAMSAPASASRSTLPERVDADDRAVPRLDRRAARRGARRPGTRRRHRAIERAEDRGVVGLGAAAGEHDLARPAAEHVGDVVAGLVDRLAGLACEAVRARRVGELLGEERQHRRRPPRAHRRGRRVVEVGEAVVHGNQARRTHWPPTAAVVEDEVMDGYTDSTYGDAFADVYDDWYHDVSDVAATVRAPRRAGRRARTAARARARRRHRPARRAARRTRPAGRRASTPARRCSPSWHENDPLGVGRRRTSATWSTACPTDRSHWPSSPSTRSSASRPSERQQACFAAVADGWRRAARSSSRPSCPRPQPGSSVTVRSMTRRLGGARASSTHDDDAQTAQGHYISFSERAACGCGRGRSATRPSSSSTRWPRPLDFVVDERWEDAQRTPFTAESPRHVTVYRTIHSRVRPEGSATS